MLITKALYDVNFLFYIIWHVDFIQDRKHGTCTVHMRARVRIRPHTYAAKTVVTDKYEIVYSPFVNFTCLNRTKWDDQCFPITIMPHQQLD